MRRLLVYCLMLAVAGGAAFFFLTSPERVYPSMLPSRMPDLGNGEKLFWAGGCGSCHAAAKAEGEDKKLLGGGQALATPFGTFYVPNISSDRETGIGGWREADFVTAMLRGVSPDNRHYYPAFPYTSYQRMSVIDLLDLKGFLDTLPAVRKVVPPHDLPFPFSVRRGLGLWKLLYLDGAPFEPDPAASEQINRGAYLVEGPGHCNECHTPRNVIGGLDRSRALAGAKAAEGDGWVPNITPHADGIGDWSAQDIAYALESGFTPSYDTLGGSMASVQANMAHLPKADREAIAAYLKSIPAHPTIKPGDK